jgi:hypothetical protein
MSTNPPRSCPVCQRALRRDWLNACAACGVETLDEVPAEVWRPRSCDDSPSPTFAVTVTLDPPPRSDSLYRDAAPQANLRVVVDSEASWTLLIPLVMFVGPFVVFGALGLGWCVLLLVGALGSGEIAVALMYALGVPLGLGALLLGLGCGYALLAHATRRTTYNFDGPTLRIEEQRFKFRRRVTTLDRTRVVDVGLSAQGHDSAQVLLLLREGGAICVRASADAADTEALAVSLTAGAGRGEARG